MATASTTAHEHDPCVFCVTRHNRSRPSFCVCKHCNIPFCLECMNRHHDDLLQTVGELSHTYNELYELLRTKQQMIVDASEEAVEDVDSYFDTYVNQLRAAQCKIAADLQETKQRAEKQMEEVNAEIELIGGDIRALAKEKVAQTTKMADLSAQMKRIETKLRGYTVMRSEDLDRRMPTLSVKFDYSPNAADDVKPSATTKQQPVKESEAAAARPQRCTHPNLIFQPLPEYLVDLYGLRSLSDLSDDVSESEVTRVKTVYDADRMASDGENILYTSHYENKSDLITYSVVNGENEEIFSSRECKQSRIEDMIWWDGILKFVCAAEDAVHTVEYTQGSLKFTRVIRASFPRIRVASNSNTLYVHYAEGGELTNMMVLYGTDFQFLRMIDVSHQQHLTTSSSFCVTDTMLAMICTRMQHTRLVFQVNFFDLSFNKLKWFPLGACTDSIEIRTDGVEGFFITTGRRKLYLVNFDGMQDEIELHDNGARIAVLGGESLAISNGQSGMQIVNYAGRYFS